MHKKSYRIIDKKPRWVFVDDNGKIIDRSPNKEELKLAMLEKENKKKYNDTNACDRCGENLHTAYREIDEKGDWTRKWLCKKCYARDHRKIFQYINEIAKSTKHYNHNDICDECKIEKLIPKNALREYDENNNWTGRWLCTKCNSRHRQRLPNSLCNTLKLITDRRSGNIKLNANHKGDLFEELTCKWRGVKNLNIEKNCYNTPIDHSIDNELGIIQTKGRLNDRINKCWIFDAYRDQNKDIDNIICYCFDRYMKILERIYIFPKEEILKRTCITIMERSSRSIPWYEKYRICEETCKNVDNIWNNIINNNDIKTNI